MDSGTRPLTYAERLEVVVGYMNHLGYVHCIECALGRDDVRDRKPPHPSWTPMRSYNLASLADECDGCHRPLVLPFIEDGVHRGSLVDLVYPDGRRVLGRYDDRMASGPAVVAERRSSLADNGYRHVGPGCRVELARVRP